MIVKEYWIEIISFISPSWYNYEILEKVGEDDDDCQF